MTYQTRRELYRQIEAERDSKVIAYVTGDRPGLVTAIAEESLDIFVDHLDATGVVGRISLVLYTLGGDIHAARSIVNLLQTFCDDLEIIVPSKCRSAGTLMCLGANKIVMTKQATLGPIDPSVHTELNPIITEGEGTWPYPVNVEDVNAFIQQARDSLPHQRIDQVFDGLAQAVHPLVLGNAYRTRAQIRMLGERLLSKHMNDKGAIANVLDFLCSDSGSHDYTIGRREARVELGLPIETPSWEFYRTIKGVYDDVVTELELRKAFNPRDLVSPGGSTTYAFPCSLIESVDFGSHVFVREGVLTGAQTEIEPGVVVDSCYDDIRRESWRFHNATND